METEKSLDGKVAIVSGGSRGIGRAIAIRFAKAGADVVIGARGAQTLAETVRNVAAFGGSATAVECDLSTAAGTNSLINAALARTGYVDILVNNVGSAAVGSFLTLTDDELLNAWTLKLLGAIRLIRGLIPVMSKKGGHIVNIIGAAGREPTSTGIAAATSNAALRVVNRGLARDLARAGISINAISPASVATDRRREMFEARAGALGVSSEALKTEALAAIPTGREVQPEEVAELALVLVDGRIPSLTGAEIVLDGGASRSI